MKRRPGASRVLHVHASFAADRPLAQRCARLMSAFGARLWHTVVAADGDFSALEGIAGNIRINRLSDFPSLRGLPLPGRLQRVARALQDYDLILTYGLGAADVALAHTMFSKVYALPPLIHHEDGSDETPRQRSGVRSKWKRRLGLGKASGLVVPTETMEHAALIDWQQPLGRVKTIRDAVDLKRFNRPSKPDAIPRLLKRPDERWIGCIAEPGSEGDTIALVDTVERLPAEWHLVIICTAVPDDSVSAAVAQRGLDHRVHFAPVTTDRAAALALFDIVTVARGAEPLPQSVIEAMAASRPVVLSSGSDATHALSVDNADLLSQEAASEALERLAYDPYLRHSIGQRNREKAEAERDEAGMVAAYRRLYSSAIGGDPI